MVRAPERQPSRRCRLFAAIACVEDVDLRTPRGIDRSVFARLVGGDWIDRNENLLITGATGLGIDSDKGFGMMAHDSPSLFEALPGRSG